MALPTDDELRKMVKDAIPEAQRTIDEAKEEEQARCLAFALKNNMAVGDVRIVDGEPVYRPNTPIPILAKTCADCRFVKTDRRPKIMDATGFGDQLMFEDGDETVYSCEAFVKDTGQRICEHAGKVIGTTPITCEAWAKPQRRSGDVDGGDARLAELDRLIAAREARTAGKDKE